MNTPPDFDTAAAHGACKQLEQVFQDCGFPVHSVSMSVASSQPQAMLFVAWRYTGPVIDGKRWRIFYAPTFRECFVAATAWLAANVQLAKGA